MQNKIQFFAAGLALALALPAATRAAKLRVGDKAPYFTAEASLAGKDFVFSLKNALKKGPVVLYFYPSAFTKGCDLEAHTFAVNKDKFDDAGATIIGVSADSIARLNAFSSDPSYCASKFPVASDSHLKVATSYGLKARQARPGAKDVRGVAVHHPFIARTTFVIGRDSKIIAMFSSKADNLTPDEHVKKALAVVQQLAAK
ncbi:MAG TPA: peroxiredoxin [Terriglobia bacterium]|nr:peroxiredoxin [Terriglobia bacterium]